MSLVNKIALGVGILLASTSMAALSVGTADARPAACNAPSGKSCVSIYNNTSYLSVRNIKTGQCFLNATPDKNLYYPSAYTTGVFERDFHGYTRSDCGGYCYTTRASFSQPDKYNYISIGIEQSGDADSRCI
jgi:hypothetical protein